ncbi:MAG: hypothetical protein QOF51_1365 [Chloroflexota bacterium]|jgi:catechol 2,3-dioxygenase-like lactoylglutathione lyase family enzyme|nr:hypothetical protein [Chloroflexota bacterium]
MGTIARLSHVGFNVPRDLFDEECEFWEKVVGLTLSHKVAGQNCFFKADPLRDHEFILFAVDGSVTKYGEEGYLLNHVSFDVATDAEIDELLGRIRANGYETMDAGHGRRRANVISPSGIRFEINTPPHTNPGSAEAREAARAARA